MPLRDDAILLVDWLNLSINLKNDRLMFGAELIDGLMRLAEQEAGFYGARLARAHFVAETFAVRVEEAIQNILLAESNKSRTAKEQADLLLAVLAMDHLHSPSGCPSVFILGTGDQDFVPLIERMIREGSNVVLLVASESRLSVEYRRIASQQNVKLVSVAEVLDLQPLPEAGRDNASATVLGLFRLGLMRRILGGDQARNSELLAQWGLLRSADHESEMEGLIRQFTKSELRRVAVPGNRPRNNVPSQRRRTALNFDNPVVLETILDADWVMVRASNRARPVSVGDLGTGRFTEDSGVRLEGIVAALKTIGWLTERADGRLETDFEWAGDGLIEPLLRVACEFNRIAYDGHVGYVTRDELFKALRSQPLANERERKGDRVAQDAIDVSRCMGLIDTVPYNGDGYAFALIDSHPLVKNLANQMKALGVALGDRVGEFLPEHEVIQLMRDRDELFGTQLFGYDTRDRQRLLRILRRARLVERRNNGGPELKIKGSAWLRGILPLPRG